jgi:hypothetical protein
MIYEIEKEDYRHACCHFIIAAKDGCVDGVESVRIGYRNGLVTKKNSRRHRAPQ